MKLDKITFNNSEEIDTVSVTMSAAEARGLLALSGKLNDYAHDKLGLQDGDGYYDCLAFVFNRYGGDSTQTEGKLQDFRLYEINEKGKK